MTMDRGSGSTSARATSGRRTSLLLALVVLFTSVIGYGATPAQAANGDTGSCEANPMVWADYGTFQGTLPFASGTNQGYIVADEHSDLCRPWGDGDYRTAEGYGPFGNAPGVSGGRLYGWGQLGAVAAPRPSGYPEPPPPAPPEPCDDGVLVAGEDWGGWGGGGTWGSGADGSGPVAEHLKAWYWDPIARAWTAWNGSYAELDAKIDEWVTLGYYEDGGGSGGDLDGFGGYGGGGSWGGSWTLACDTDDDDVPDGFIAPEPGAPMWEPLYPEGATPITAPPAPAAPAPSGDCDFGITDPASWLCGLAGLFGNLLDALRWIVGWLGRVGSFLLDLFVPDLQVLQDSFADVDTAWDASGPGQLTGGVTDIAAPVLSMDENMPTTCEGPQFTLPLPASRSFSMNPLSTCGELTQYILGVVYPLETALIYLGGFFLGLRIVTRPFGMETPGTSQAATA